jgi:hypothetical protein
MITATIFAQLEAGAVVRHTNGLTYVLYGKPYTFNGERQIWGWQLDTPRSRTWKRLIDRPYHDESKTTILTANNIVRVLSHVSDIWDRFTITIDPNPRMIVMPVPKAMRSLG